MLGNRGGVGFGLERVAQDLHALFYGAGGVGSRGEESRGGGLAEEVLRVGDSVIVG